MAPIAVIMKIEVEGSRLNEFLDIMRRDAVGSRSEPGCLRFDLLEERDKPNSYVFYEVYRNGDAVAFHQHQPHYKACADFTGVVRREATFATAVDFR
ncbi:hypothetical protein CTAYLR_000108 [Chrysophaeum taylorii]|uniref:ABM domain-containing protein n=1 Tax=Chrysophaeum taylorii TaxID=2483200 RepID=A0AAD7UHE5_9STRA|nr:hypothetical protein CTAYLR_000108 [Chrysophaeum taylorii]